MTEKIESLLAELGISYRWVKHPPVFTVAESLKHIEDKRPIKNILLKEKGTDRTVLVIIAGEQRVDTNRLARELGMKKLQFASADLLEKTLGVRPGAVSIFGLLHPGATDVQVVIDRNLLKEPELGFHPNDNTSTIFISGSSLEKILVKTQHANTAMKLYE